MCMIISLKESKGNFTPVSLISLKPPMNTGPDFQIGDMVTYHGSMTEYHNDIYEITDLFDYIGVPCARLNGYRFGSWIERCRVASIQHVIRVIEETHPNKGDSDGAAIYSGTDRPE